MAHYITATHKVSKRTVTFIKIINPKDSTDYYYKDTDSTFNGKAHSLEFIQRKFTITGEYST